MHVVLVYLLPFRRNSLLKCASQSIIVKNALKLLILGIQGHSRSSILTFLKSSSPVPVMISSMSVPICNHFHGRWANSGKITSFQGGCPFFSPYSWWPPKPSGVKFCHKILETLSYHMVKTRSLYITWSWNGTGTWQIQDRRHQDRITIANTRYASSRA